MTIIVLFVVATIALFLGCVALFQKHRDLAAVYFFTTMIGTAFWAWGIGLFLGSQDEQVLRTAATIYYVAAALIAASTTLLSLTVGAKRIKRSLHVYAVVLPFSILSIVLLVNPSILFESFVIESGGNSVILINWSYVIYIVYFLAYFGSGLGILAMRSRRATGQLRKRLSYLLGAYSIAGAIGAYFNLILPALGNYSLIWIGPLGLFIFVPIVYIAITRHGLFDIRLAVVRTATYLLSLATLSGLYFLLAFTISRVFLDSKEMNLVASPTNVVIALLLAFVFQPVRHFFDRLTSRIFYRDGYSASEFFASLNKELAITTDLRGLLHRATTVIQKTLKSEQVFFFVYMNDDRHVSAGSVGHSRLPLADTRYLDESLSGGALLTDSLETTDQRYRLLVSHKIALVLPLRRADQTIGYLFLGEQKGSGYVHRDIRVLETVSDELIIAIQNALSVLEIKDLNETLQQRIDEATKELRASNAQLRRLDEAKDEFVSMASHQLRTPLTSVKGYIDMVMEGDAGEINTMQKQLLGEAFTSSERMVHLINDFLNVSRLQTGKFMIDKRPTDLAKVVAQELDSLKTSAESRDLRFRYIAPKDIPNLELDEGKFRQVIMNFADNALYYSKPKSTIKVRLTRTDDQVVFTVTDSGIGVPVDEQEQLFSKFYRASNARKQRPDGTGVGLFLAKKVVVAHGGSMVFESTEGKGSTFGFSLKLDAVRLRSDADDFKDKDDNHSNDTDSNQNRP